MKSDYSWSVPNRRFIDSGLYLPSIRSEGIDAIAVIVDTSGSLPAETLAAFWAELREVAAEIRPGRVVVLQVDAAVQDAARVRARRTSRGKSPSTDGGGTDFRPGFEWLDAQGHPARGVPLFYGHGVLPLSGDRASVSGRLLQLVGAAGGLEPRALGRAHRHRRVTTRRHRRTLREVPPAAPSPLPTTPSGGGAGPVSGAARTGPAGAVSDPRFRLFPHTIEGGSGMNFIAPRAEPHIREIPLSRLALAPRECPQDPARPPRRCRAQGFHRRPSGCWRISSSAPISRQRIPDRVRDRLERTATPWSPADAG